MKRAFAFLLSLASALAFADGGFDLTPGLRTWGADATLGYSLPTESSGVHTRLVAGGGASWENRGYYRSPDGLLLTSPQSSSVIDHAAYNDVDLSWTLGIERSLIPGGTDGNLVRLFAFYDGRWDDHLKSGSDQLVFASGRPDSGTFLGHSILGGIAYDDVEKDQVAKTQRGFYAEASGEWGPAPLQFAGEKSGSTPAATGDLDFFRWNASARGYVPLFEALKDGKNLVSAYAGSFVAGDYAFAQGTLPQYVKETFGGTAPRVGLSDAVRGFEPYRFDANLKFVNNNEVRIVGPAMIFADCNPILILYVDQGWYGVSGEGAANTAEGYIASAGFGIWGNAFDLAKAGLYCNYILAGKRLDPNTRFNVSLDFGYKF